MQNLATPYILLFMFLIIQRRCECTCTANTDDNILMQGAHVLQINRRERRKKDRKKEKKERSMRFGNRQHKKRLVWSHGLVVLVPELSPFTLLLKFEAKLAHRKPPVSEYRRSMGRSGTRLPGLCLNHVATRVRVWFPPPPPVESKAAVVDPCRTPVVVPDSKEKESSGGEGERERRKVMIVVESSGEAKCALQWALSHAVQSNDIVVLLDVAKQPKQVKQTQREGDLKDYELLYAMKSICLAKRPEVEIEVSLIEGKERGPTIVEEARKQKASLLVLGQKKRSVTWRLLMLWAGSHRPVDGGGVVEYCIQNATCMALAVRRKSRRGGGYLITSRRHKDFWLLA